MAKLLIRKIKIRNRYRKSLGDIDTWLPVSRKWVYSIQSWCDQTAA
jgi:hypothetical protein